jgi:hypothetical protein
MKTIIGAAIGIILAAAVIIPLTNAGTGTEPEAQRTPTEIQAAQAEIELKTAGPEEAAAVVEEIKAEETGSPEPEKVEVKAETATEPKAGQTSPPPVTPGQPETWWEDGKEYTMINGRKAEISPEGNRQLSYYDWENDPLKDVPGPFDGNGGN